MIFGPRRYHGANLSDAPRRRGAHDGFRRRSLALVLPLALVLVGSYASTAQAEEPHNTVSFSCTSVTYTFTGFPNANNNTVSEFVYLDGKIIATAKFSFNGPTGSNTVKISVPPGHHGIDGRAKWNTNGVRGGKDTPDKGGITCDPEPGFSIQKLQKIAGGSGPFTTSTLTSGHVGQTVDYEIVVTNTGNVPLTFSNFTDPHCDEGTITGGPGANPVASGASTTYLCDHVLTEADREAGSYTNTATDTGTPEEGPPITETSNTVVVELPTPTNTVGFSCASVTFTFTGFPNANNNTVSEFIYSDKKLIYSGTFTFNGPSGSNTVTISLPPGHHSIDGRTKWNTNGFKGGKDTPGKKGLNCPEPAPAFSIEKLQEIAGSGGGFTTATLTGEPAQTVDYEIVVTNTGNVPLTFSNFTDPHCDEGTITGGPGANPVAAGASTTYLCDHVLSEADLAEGTYSNTATETGTPPEGAGAPITHTSNTVVVKVTERS